MKLKIIIGGIIIAAAVVFGALSFVESNVEYLDFAKASGTTKKVQVKGVWLRDKETSFDAQSSQFTFYMKDDNGKEEKVVYGGARPNNFELAEAIVVKGKLIHGTFEASEILTKCPSKYQSQQGSNQP